MMAEISAEQTFKRFLTGLEIASWESFMGTLFVIFPTLSNDAYVCTCASRCTETEMHRLTDRQTDEHHHQYLHVQSLQI